MISAISITGEYTCTVCMENIHEENRCVRPCGHMMCDMCDASWRSRGKIEEVTIKKKCSVFITVSGCPSCRRKDVPSDYESRSKDSLFHEIQFLTKTLYMCGIQTPMAYIPVEVAVLNTPIRAPVPPPDIVTPYIPEIQAPAPIVLIRRASVQAPISSSGRCSRRELGPLVFNPCYTRKTKLRCDRCNRSLCRSCRGTGCICQNS